MEIRLKDLCQSKGITQKDLALELGVTEMTLSRAAKGNTSISLLEKIAKSLNVEIWELFTEIRDKSDFIAIVKNKNDFYSATTLKELEEIVQKIKDNNNL